MSLERTAGQSAQRRVLLLADRRNSALKKVLRDAGFQVLETFTTDHAVAVCVNNRIDAVVLDQNWFVETEGWSVAQSVKAVTPNVSVLLILDTRKIRARLPPGVDAALAAANPSGVVARLKQLTGQDQQPVRRKSIPLPGRKVVRAKKSVPLSGWIRGIDSPK